MTQTNQSIKKSSTDWSTLISISIIGLMFFIFGFVSWVNAILIPYFKIACELTHFQSYLVAFAFYVAYFFMSVPSSFLLEKVGFKKGMMMGFFAMDEERATQVMLHVHTRGRGVCGVYTREVAESKVSQVNDFARLHQHPLLCMMEKA